METTAIETPFGRSIYTLAQSGTRDIANDTVYVTGKGSKMNSMEKIKKRSERKIIGQSMALNLVDVAMAKNQPQRVKSYWNTYYCQTNVTSSDNRLYGNYCKNRFCPICLGIRKAEIINKYYPVLKNWKDACFVTLTFKSYGKNSLPKAINSALRAFNQIKEKFKKREQRGTGERLIGVRSLECNFNSMKLTYNVHFHMIVKNEHMALILIDEWLKKWTLKYTSPKAQHYRKVMEMGKDLLEIIKYGTKIFTEVDVTNKVKQKGAYKIYVSALDNILAAMKDHRIFDRFGFNLPKTEKPRGGTIKKLTNYDEWEFIPKITDWVSVYSGELLTNYKIPFSLMNLLDNYIDVQLE